MGDKLAHFILANKNYILVGIVILTVFFGYKGKGVDLQYEMPKLLPSTHKDVLTYQNFKELFGKDGFQILIATKDKDFYTPKKFNKWKEFRKDISKMPGIDSVYSETNLYTIKKDDSLKSFNLVPINDSFVNSQQQLDSIKRKIRSLPFYDGTIYNDSNDFHAMLVFVNPEFFNSKERGTFAEKINKKVKGYEKYYSGELYLTGLPFIRATNMNKIKEELGFFMVLSLMVTILVLFFFFRSLRVIAASGIVVTIGVVWTMGIVGLFDYKLSAIMGLLPPLIIVIGIPNCVYLINKYQQLYIDSGNKEYALKNIIIKIGSITLLTNATTAFGLATFVFTDCEMLFSFGLVAFFSIIALFLITVLLIPILFSFMPTPKVKHTKHLKKNWLAKFLAILEQLVTKHRKIVYILSLIVIIASIVGANKLKTSGKMVDDLPNGNKTKTDLIVFQENLIGIMPFEVVLDVKKKGKYQQTKVLKKIDSLQNYLESYSEIGRTMSMVDVLKFVNQGFYNGNPEKFKLPLGRDKAFIKKYLKKNNKKNDLSIKMFIDSTGTKTRISSQVNDIGIDKLDSLLQKISPDIDEILNPDKKQITSLINKLNFNEKAESNKLVLDSIFENFSYLENAYLSVLSKTDSVLSEQLYENGLDYDVIISEGKESLLLAVEKTYIGNEITGFTVPFTRGTKYLIFNLFISLVIAILGIAILMSFLFKSFWMVLITVITNMLPLIFTAGVMGYFDVALKPSTILVFSISLGIAVDDAIHYLAKFKQELKVTNGDLKLSVHNALKETGVSMFYTSVILFFGFSIFIASDYGGTQALGLLISVTLLVAMLSNLVLLPSLLLSFKERIER